MDNNVLDYFLKQDYTLTFVPDGEAVTVHVTDRECACVYLATGEDLTDCLCRLAGCAERWEEKADGE